MGNRHAPGLGPALGPDEFLALPVLAVEKISHEDIEPQCSFLSMGLVGPVFGADIMDSFVQVVSCIVQGNGMSVSDVLRGRVAVVIAIQPYREAGKPEELCDWIRRAMDHAECHAIHPSAREVVAKSLKVGFAHGPAGHVVFFLSCCQDLWHPLAADSAGRPELRSKLLERIPIWKQAETDMGASKNSKQSLRDGAKTEPPQKLPLRGQSRAERQKQKRRAGFSSLGTLEDTAVRLSSVPVSGPPWKSAAELQGIAEQAPRVCVPSAESELQSEMLQLQALQEKEAARIAFEVAEANQQAAKQRSVRRAHQAASLLSEQAAENDVVVSSEASDKILNRRARRREEKQARQRAQEHKRQAERQQQQDAKFLREVHPAMREPLQELPNAGGDNFQPQQRCPKPSDVPKPAVRKSQKQLLQEELQNILWNNKLRRGLA